jgi:predicted GNAT family acetyltransferase
VLREETGIAVRLNGDGKGGDFRVVDNSDGHRYDAFVDEELAGGRGIGSRLVAAALDDIQSRELELVPIFPFVRRYIERHPEYANLVSAR